MNLTIEREFADKLAAQFRLPAEMAKVFKMGHSEVELPLMKMTRKQLDYLHGLYTAAGADYRGKAVQISTLKKALDSSDTATFKSQDLRMLVPAIARWLVKDGKRGWLFKLNSDGKAIAYVVTSLIYTPSGRDSPASVGVSMIANARGKVTRSGMSFGSEDIAKKTVGELITKEGFLKETDELIEEYDAAEATYVKWRQMFNTQFTARGTGFLDGGDWRRGDTVVLAAGEAPARLVNDEEILKERSLKFTSEGLTIRQEGSGRYREDVGDIEDPIDEDGHVPEKALEIPKDLFRQVPVHPYIWTFHLDLHEHVWAHVVDMKEYVYRPETKEKLILPEHQMDLVDLLTSDMGVLKEDIVAGKTGGTTILSTGKPGIGKTLMAEVYAEVMHKPLYKVQSGQLGLTAEELEKALEKILSRAQRWGAVMLIDEADVYLKRRGDDLQQNAIVGVFLRTLEYFNGLLFLTSNRYDDIDEAIISRAIAHLHFLPPVPEARYRIWKVMFGQYGLKEDEKLLWTLVDAFPGASGRDIKGLARLTEKWVRVKKVPLELDAFRRMAMFKGVDYNKGNVDLSAVLS